MDILLSVEALAVVLGLIYVVLAIRQSPWCWPASALGATIYMVLFFEGRLFMESLLQLFYIFMAGYGLWVWRFGGRASTPLRITRRPLVWHAKVLVFIALATAIASLLLSRFTEADAVVVDSLTTIASLVTTWMVARKIAENWLYWVVIDAIYVYLFAFKGFYLTALLYTLFLGMAAYGFYSWKKESIQIKGV